MTWRALALLFLALLPSRWIGRLLAGHTALSTELVGAAAWTCAVTAVFVFAAPEARPARLGPLGWRDVGLGLGAGLLLFVVGAAGYVASEAVLGLSRSDALSTFASLRGAGEVAAVAVSLVAIAVAEEVAFRGMLLEGLRREVGTGFAIAATAALFAAYHLSAYQLLSTLVYGGLLAGLVVWTGGLWPAVVAHLTLNGLGVLLSLAATGASGG